MLFDVIKHLYERKGLILKEGTLCHKKRIMYTHGKDFVGCFKSNYDIIYNTVKERAGVELGMKGNDKAIQRFFELCVESKVMLKVRKKQGDAKRYPEVLFPPLSNEDVCMFDENEYYWVNTFWEGMLFKGIWLLFIVVAVVSVLFVCLSQVWSIKVKIFVIWALISFVFVLVAITFCSLFVTLIGFVCGYDVILLPNLMEMKMSLKQRLCSPFIARFPRKDSFGIVVVRVSIVIGL